MKKVTVEYPMSVAPDRTMKEKWTQTELFCLKCGQKGLWQFASQHICVSCNAVLERLEVFDPDETDLLRIGQIKEK